MQRLKRLCLPVIGLAMVVVLSGCVVVPYRPYAPGYGGWGGGWHHGHYR